ncbi:MAG: DNA-binding transcriptional LysR family regulator [Phenylobacterium sp.]
MLFSDARLDLIEQGIDLAIRAGEMDDSTFKAKRVGQINRVLVCSADYWHQRNAVNQALTKPEDLTQWNWITMAMLPHFRTMVGPDGRQVQAQADGNITVNSAEAAAQLCIYGLGLATPPDFLVEGGIQSGTLIHVLPQWLVTPVPLYALWPGNVTDNSNVRRLLDFLEG